MSQNQINTEVSLRRGDVHWRIRSRWQKSLFQRAHPDDPNHPDTLDWFNPEGDPRATLVKRGYRRSVWRIELGSDTVYAKIVAPKANSIASKVRQTLGKTASHREWRVCVAGMRRGVPVVRPVAFGVRGGPLPATVLITEAFENAKELSAAWSVAIAEQDPNTRHDRIKKLTNAVADLYANAHRAGFVHQDGHPGNILVADKDRDQQARFADTTDAILTAGRPPWIQIIRSLAHLDQSMKRVATRTQRLRFVKDYLDCLLRASQSDLNEIWATHRMVPAIFAQEAIHAASLARQRDRRIARVGRYFTRIALGGGWRATVVLDLERRHVFPEQGTPDFAETRWRKLLAGIDNDENGIQTVRTRLAEAGLSVQTSSAGGFLAALRWRAIGSRAWRLFFRCHALRHRDISAPLTLACLEHRNTLGGVDRTLLIYPADQQPPAGG